MHKNICNGTLLTPVENTARVTVDLGKDVTTCVKEKTLAVNLPLVSVTPVVNLLPVSTKLAVHL
jgi:hypothetical protein